MQKKYFKRIIAFAALFATVFVLLFSAFYIVEHVEHDCIGKDCPVCAVMEQCGSNIKNLGTAVFIACAIVICFSFSQENVQEQLHIFTCNSLISKKVRMNN